MKKKKQLSFNSIRTVLNAMLISGKVKERKYICHISVQELDENNYSYEQSDTKFIGKNLAGDCIVKHNIQGQVLAMMYVYV